MNGLRILSFKLTVCILQGVQKETTHGECMFIGELQFFNKLAIMVCT